LLSVVRCRNRRTSRDIALKGYDAPQGVTR
jgi:hypothetical protein